MGYLPSHHHIKHAILLLLKFDIFIKDTHQSGEYIYGLVPSLKKHVVSTEVPVEMVWTVTRKGWDFFFRKRETVLIRSKDSKAAKRKRDNENETPGNINNKDKASTGTDAKANNSATDNTETTAPSNIEQDLYIV